MTTRRFAIHAHLYYPDLWHELAGCIRSFSSYGFDLFVTTPHPDPGIREMVLHDFPQAQYLILENRGYDVGPFLEVLNRIDLASYDFVVKLHTKRDYQGWFNFRHVHGSQWRDILLDFCRTPEHLEKTLSVFRDIPNAGAVTHADAIVTHGDYFEKPAVKRNAAKIVRRLGLPRGRCAFVGGTMFIVRAGLLAPLVGKTSLQDFSIVKSHELWTLAHVYERVLGYLITSQGMDILPTAPRRRILASLWFLVVPTYRVLAFIRNLMPDRWNRRRLSFRQ